MSVVHSSTVFIYVTSLLLLLNLSDKVVVDASADMSVLAGPPERPADFNNPEELREYLKGLNDYFSLVGRPRSATVLCFTVVIWVVTCQCC